MSSPLWRNRQVIDDIHTSQACVLKAFGTLLSFCLGLGGLQLLGQVAPTVAQVIHKDVLHVILHFCNPSKGLYTPEPLLKANLLQTEGIYPIKNTLCDTLGTIRQNLAKHPMGKIFIIGLEGDESKVGHCALGILQENGSISFGCDPGDFVDVTKIYIYVLPGDIRQLILDTSEKIPKATPLSLSTCRLCAWVLKGQPRSPSMPIQQNNIQITLATSDIV